MKKNQTHFRKGGNIYHYLKRVYSHVDDGQFEDDWLAVFADPDVRQNRPEPIGPSEFRQYEMDLGDDIWRDFKLDDDEGDE